ncbi:2'-5'-oligoadenylate synthase 2-like isoform X2 [Hippopotamus amphibius kiboko]|uniref:2'-5'-oligoadenylate synthase 2-like isoform X2 n=1 Tax=Hippopotamus amphibius kiboko TaxID=575201 RepID=UPI002591D5AD|nr:2'-5'-oligoadenylate synthase 2-like isoform X2 [Hippopotamus amphibius kiboko]
MGNWESHLYEQPAQKLGEFIHNNLRPFEDCQKQIDQTVDTICAVLQKAEQSPLVTSVAKGGSYGRKTVLRGKSDGTLVIFFSGLEQFQDQKKSQHKLLSQIWAQLKQCEVTRQQLAAKMEIQTINDRLFILLSTKQQTITFEMLPAFNALGLSEKPSLCTYRELERSLNMRKASPGEFSVCFTELQEKFFSNHPSKLRDLILLVKYWCLQCQKEQTSLSLLPLYALELLTVYAWEQGCGAEDFDIAEGLRTVLGLIEKQEQLCVYWMVNYNFEYDAIRNILLGHLRSPRPIILDPTDPTHNVSRGNTCWQLLKKEAQIWLSSLRLNESPGPSWNVLPTSLYVTPSHLLDKFIKDFLQPDKTFLDQIKKAVDIICKFLKENCFRHSTTKIQKIVKGGSTAKGTALKSGSDANLVVFTDSLKSYTSQKSESWSIIKEIHKQLEACQQEKDFEVKFEISKGKAPWVLSFTLKSKVLNESVDFNILPAFNALGELKSSSTPSPRIYVDLINLNKSSDALGGEFSTCFTELQCNFVRSQPTKLKDLIRLVKHWYKWCESKLKQKGSLPPKYALELLTIYAWEQGSRAQDFDTAEGFRAVLELVTKYQQLCVFWKVNYDYEDVTVRNFLLTQIQRTRPVILDPADPTGDVGGGDRWCWHLLAKEATEWLSSVCFKDGLGYPTQVWNVPTVQTPGSCGTGMHSVVKEMSLFGSYRFLE